MSNSMGNQCRTLVGGSLSIKGMEVIDEKRNAYFKDLQVNKNVSIKEDLEVCGNLHVKGDLVVDPCGCGSVYIPHGPVDEYWFQAFYTYVTIDTGNIHSGGDFDGLPEAIVDALHFNCNVSSYFTGMSIPLPSGNIGGNPTCGEGLIATQPIASYYDSLGATYADKVATVVGWTNTLLDYFFNTGNLVLLSLGELGDIINV